MGLTDISVPAELLARALRGEPSARQSLYAALAPAAAAFIRRLIGQRELAEDLFQDTMMLFYERLSQFRGEAPLGAWLRQIALTRCLMHLRSPWQRARLSLEPVDSSIEAEVMALVSPGYRPEQLDLERALARLGPTARAIVWMYEVEGYSHQEIAAAFGRSESFSKSQLARAHARLRAWLEPTESHTSCTMI
ncbi:MAG: RNA polymerase sigma factor [Gammaproteobacteria bacterium]|nr:RNA polymerase sigma factor [Gammaproteobacteria bacterium]MBV9620400.1 RNA polymerase sigma factor [Gammaproteobacteria bacterium]